MEFAILKFLLFLTALLDGVYLGVLAHELGHAIVALVLTRQNGALVACGITINMTLKSGSTCPDEFQVDVPVMENRARRISFLLCKSLSQDIYNRWRIYRRENG